MKIKLGSRLNGLATRILSLKKEMTGYSIQSARNPFQSTRKDVQLSSYYRYTTTIERRL
ncbi:MAG: hypothetical protein O3C20_03105 [Verrucomicrobia bacterium]|nr:hypothetical protein [Verrucomicrobiota bacterium]